MGGDERPPQAGPDIAVALRPLADAIGGGTAATAATLAPASRAEPVPEDALWADPFGSWTLSPDLYAVAVSGETVYIGGTFFFGMAAAANDTYNRVAMWDGTGWKRMGDGVNGTVYALAVVGQDVYAGGDFTVAGDVAAARLARWDGTAWSPVAGGVSDPNGNEAAVRSLVTDGATLYVGGTFTRAGDVDVRSLAALDLETMTWTDLGGGVGYTWSDGPGEVRALALDDTSLYVGGAFDVAGTEETTSFARVDTTDGTWTTFGAGMIHDGLSGWVHSIAVDPTSKAVVIGGRFTTAATVPSWNLVELRGSTFRSLGDVSSFGGSFADVFAVAISGGMVYAGGYFTTVGNAEASSWARWDGTAWASPGDGVDGTVTAMAPTDDGGVVVLGAFSASGTLRVKGGGIWTGTGWRTFGQGVTSDPDGNGSVETIVPIGPGAYVGGLFDQAGQLPVGSIARWTGDGWDAMAGGVGAAISHGQVFAMVAMGTDLYVGGRFATAGGTVMSNIAKWDGELWSPLGEGVDGFVYDMVVLGDKLYVGGGFNVAGRVRARNLACWDPATATWTAVGNNPIYDDDVRALATIGDRWLVIAGDFNRFFEAGVTIVEGLNGTALFDTAEPLTDKVLSGYYHIEGTTRFGGIGMNNALRVIDGDLYLGGWFDVAGVMAVGPDPKPGFPARNITVWHFATDGQWEPIAGGTDHQVEAFSEVDGALAVGGWFKAAGDVAASGVALFDRETQTWRALGTGLSDGARGGSWALALAQSDEAGLWVGGQFPVAGMAPSANVALWTGTRAGG